MQPATYNFRIRRGDSETLATFLKRREIFSGKVDIVPADGRTVHWAAALPDGALEKTTADGGGLGFDSDTGQISWPMPPDLTARFVGAIPYRLWVVFSDGTIQTWLVGTITGEG
jgi:hypothetical protein